MNLESYVLVTYQEYQELLLLKKQQEEKKKYEIFYRPLHPKFDGLLLELEIPVRLYNCLTAEVQSCKNFQFLGDLVTKTRFHYSKIYGFGRKSYKDLKEDIARYERRHNLPVGYLKLEQKLPQFIIDDLNAKREETFKELQLLLNK